MSAYLDTSILLATLIAEPMTEAVYDYLSTDPQELLISDFAAAEVASTLSRLVRMALLSEADATARLADFDAWRAAMSSPVDIGATDARLAYIYVRRFDLGLRAPDALHLAIARRLDATLVTPRPAPGDRRSRTGCRRRGAEDELSRSYPAVGPLAHRHKRHDIYADVDI